MLTIDYNRYLYARADPLNLIDPTGHVPELSSGDGIVADYVLVPNGRYLCTESYGCFDNHHWGAGNPGSLITDIENVVAQGGGMVEVRFETAFAKFSVSYGVAGTIPPDKILNAALGIYSDASIRFERWEQLVILGLGTTFAVEDLPTHYLSFVEAATDMSKEDIFLQLSPVTGTDSEPPRTIMIFGDETSKNRQMTPRIHRNGQWINVSWPNTLAIAPLTDRSYWRNASTDTYLTPGDALEYIWNRVKP